MATVERAVTFTASSADGYSSEDVESTPRFIVLTEVREVLDIKLVDVTGGL